MNINIRSFKKEDSLEVVQLWQICELIRPWNDPSKDIERKCALQDDLFLIAEQGGKIIGSVMGGYDGHRGWINYLAVHPDGRRMGLGRRLIHTVQERLLVQNCPKINLQIRHDNNQVIAFYESLGFIEDNCRSFGKRLISDE